MKQHLYQFARSFNKIFKTSMFDYCNLEVPDGTGNSTSIATKDNGLCTFLHIKGNLRHVGASRLRQNITRVLELIKDGTLYVPGTKVDFIYIRDKKRSKRHMDRSLEPMKRTSNRTGVDLEWAIEEIESTLVDDITVEEVYVVVYTSLSIIDKESAKEALEDRSDEANEKGSPLVFSEYSQNPSMVVKSLRASHEANVNAIRKSFNQICSIKELTAREALKVIRNETASKYTSDNWEPQMPGDRIPLTSMNENPMEYDFAKVSYPAIGYQIFPAQPERCVDDLSIVEVGDTYQAPILVDLGQREPSPFKDLEESLPSDTPLRLIFTVESGHEDIVSRVNRRQNAALFLSMTNGDSKEIHRASKNIIEMAEETEETFVNITISGCTWGDTLEEARKNKRSLAKSLQNWGGIDTFEEKGDAIQAWCTTLPSFSHRSIRIANTFPYPSSWVFHMLPLDRAFSPFDSGSLLMKTLRNNLFPIGIGSTIQPSSVDYIFAGSGSGKSTLLSAQSIAFLLSSRNQVIPRLSVLDVGPNGKQLVDIIKDSLPPNQKELAQSLRLQNNKKTCVNFLDTALGSRYPDSQKKGTITNLMATILSPADLSENEKIIRLSEFSASLVDALYSYYSDNENPKNFDYNLVPAVDEGIKKHNIDVDEGTTWWDIVDELFDKGEIKLAEQAQRLAVPTLQDATAVLSESQQLNQQYKNASIGHGDETMIDFAKQAITSAVSMYPVLSNPTVYDISSAKIISIDLQDVVGGNSDQDKKKTSIMYMLGRFILTRNFFIHEDLIPEYNKKYQKYHERVLKESKLSPKRIIMDEIHYGMISPYFVEQLITDGRIIRKYDVQMAMVSQYIDDLKSKLKKIIYTYYILSLGNEDEEKEVIDKMELKTDVVKAMRANADGVDAKNGTAMLVKAHVKGGSVEHICRLKLGLKFLMGISTTHEDSEIRKSLAEKVGLSPALNIMKLEYPSGQPAETIRKKISRGDFEGEGNNMYESLAEQLTEKYQEFL